LQSRYIHANYRFIVDPRGDYRAQSEDADIHLEWDNVLQIIVSSKSQAASCPICLGEPTAPRMAKCGHIFCAPCLIRYMHSEDAGAAPEKRARWQKCPICWDRIYVSETRPARFYEGQEGDAPREGGDVVLRLVTRKPGSTLAMPRESGDVVFKGEHIPWHLATEVMDYAHLMKGSEDYMNQQYDEALAAIELLEKEDELMFGEDSEWTGRAKRLIRESKEKIKGIGNPPEQPKKPESRPERAPIQFNASDEGVPEMYLTKHAQHTPSLNGSAEPYIASDSVPSENNTNANYVPKTIAEMRARHLEKPQPNEYLFYHGLQHYYLSPLDIRILQAAFGSYKHFPSSILPRVERVSNGHVVDDELRKRVKYLGHLPYGCEVGFLECDWTDTVSPEILKDFATQIDRRRKRHSEKEAREEKDRVRIEKASEREIAHIRRNKRPSIPDDLFSADNLPSLGGGSATDSSGTSPPWAHRTNSAFASLASPGTSPNAQRTVWGTAAVQMDAEYANLPGDSEFGVSDGWLQGWEKDMMREEDELVAQAAQMSLQNGAEAVAAAASASAEGDAGTAGKGKKGKKGKKITLMSTSNRRTA
jgi:hypothetical protein